LGSNLDDEARCSASSAVRRRVASALAPRRAIATALYAAVERGQVPAHRLGRRLGSTAPSSTRSSAGVAEPDRAR
jgi:hypothetical protein